MRRQSFAINRSPQILNFLIIIEVERVRRFFGYIYQHLYQWLHIWRYKDCLSIGLFALFDLSFHPSALLNPTLNILLQMFCRQCLLDTLLMSVVGWNLAGIRSWWIARGPIKRFIRLQSPELQIKYKNHKISRLSLLYHFFTGHIGYFNGAYSADLFGLVCIMF